MTARSHWQVQVLHSDGEWFPVITDGKAFCEGYAFARRDGSTPCLACRVIQPETGKISIEFPASLDVGIGLVAGSPTPEQYEDAANRALARASAIRFQMSRDKARR